MQDNPFTKGVFKNLLKIHLAIELARQSRLI